MPRRNRRFFTPEQKADAVRLVRKVGSVSRVAKDLDLTETALRKWVQQAEIDEGRGAEGALTSEEKAAISHRGVAFQKMLPHLRAMAGGHPVEG